MRMLNSVIPVAPKFDVTPSIVVTTMKPMRGGISMYLPHVKLGQPVPGKITCHRVILGARFAGFVANNLPCPKEGEALFGFCPACHADVAGDRIRRVEEKVEFFTTSREVGKHDPVKVINPLSRGSLILSKEKGTLMVVEERRGDADDIGMKMFVAGSSVKMTVISSNPEYQRIGEMCVGEHWSGPSLVGVDRLLALKNGDRVTIQRALPSGREEEITIEVKASWPRIVAAKVLKAALAPAVAQPTNPETVDVKAEPQRTIDESAIANEVAEEVGNRLRNVIGLTPRESHDRVLRANAVSPQDGPESLEIDDEPSPELILSKLPSLPTSLIPQAVKDVDEKVGRMVDKTIAKMISEIESTIKPENSTVEVDSIVWLFKHVNDLKRIGRIKEYFGQEISVEDLVGILIDPIRKMVELPLMREHEGRPFIFKFGKNLEMGIAGNVIENGILQIKTLYGPGNPVDKSRVTVDITK